MNSTTRKRGIGELLSSNPKVALLDNLVEISTSGEPKGVCVITPKIENIELKEWAMMNQPPIESNLRNFGAILFRGFNLTTTECFGEIVKSLIPRTMEYKQRSSPRTELADRIYTSTDYPRTEQINFHNELSYAANWPTKICFFCLKPAASGGQTPIADCRKVLGSLSDDTKSKFSDKGISYVRRLRGNLGLAWQEVFQTEDRSEVENMCKKDNVNYQWISNDELTLNWKKPAIVEHPLTGEKIWFNHGYFFNSFSVGSHLPDSLREQLPFNTFYGDGTAIEEGVLLEIKKAYDENTISFPWQQGDLLLLDNMLMAHGRFSFEGDRKIAVAMGEPYHRNN